MAAQIPVLPPAEALPQRVDGAVNPEPIFCSKVTTTALDSRLETVLDRYVNNGTAEQYGVVLFNNIPPSRPRTMPPTKSQTVQEWPLTCRMPKTKIDGCYILNTLQLGSRSQDWMGQLEAQSNAAAAETIDSQTFVNALVSERSMGYQCESIYGMAAGAGYKQQLKVKQWPTAFGRTIVWRAYAINSNEFLNGTYLTVSSPGAAIPMEKSMANLVKIFYHHRGTPVIWIVVPPSESQKFENCIKTLFNQEIKEPSCSQFVKHLNLWIRPELLQKWGVGYIQVKLEAMQMLVFFPSCYHWCMSSGFSIIESKLSGTQKWNVESYRFCDASNSLCNAGRPNRFFKISQQEVDAILKIDASGIKRRRPNKKKTVATQTNMEELNRVLDGVEHEMGIDGDDELLRMDMRARLLAPPSGEVPAAPLGDNHFMSDFELYPDLDSMNIDPRVLTAENDFLREQIEYIQQKYLATAKLHAEAEAKLAEALKRLGIVEEELVKKVPSAAVFHAAAEEANQVVLEREHEIRELKELLYGMNAHQGAAADENAPPGGEMEVDSGAGMDLSEEGGESFNRN